MNRRRTNAPGRLALSSIPLLFGACLGTSSCTPATGSFSCAGDEDCVAGRFCSTDGICTAFPDSGAPAGEDAGSRDAGNVDAGNVDAGNVDAGNVDAGNVDAGNVDAGTGDAGTGDAGTGDAGTGDAGNVDAGTGDAGNVDAGTGDAGTGDAGMDDAGAPPAAWQYSGFQYRWRIDVAGADEPLTNLPVLVSLTQFAPARPSSLRAFSASDGALAVDLERDANGGSPLLWVRVATLPTLGTTFYVYADGGERDAGPVEQAGVEVWSNNYEAVWHLSSGPARDATARLPSATDTDTGVDVGGQIGAARAFTQTAGSVRLTSAQIPVLDGATEAFVSAWIKLNSSGALPNAVNRWRILSISTASATPVTTSRVAIDVREGWALHGLARPDTGVNFSSVTGTALPQNAWVHVGMRINFSAGVLTPFVDGRPAAIGDATNNSGYAVEDTPPWGIALGTEDDGTEPNFFGSIDEVRVSRGSRSDAWIAAEHDAMLTTGGLAAVSPREEEP